MQKLHYVFIDGSTKDIPIDETKECVKIRREEIPANVKYMDFMPELFTAEAGDEGFMLIPSVEGSHHSALTFFRPRENCEEIFPESSMPIYACQRGDHTILAIVTGMKFDYSLVSGVCDGKYYLYPRFILDETELYEDIEVRFIHFHGDVRYPELAHLSEIPIG